MYHIESNVSSEIIIDKSRFIGQLYIVHSVEEANQILTLVRQTHQNANHNCYAYVINEGHEVKSSDDKEPAKTAGVPILEVLKHHELTDVLCVVTRYFGGIKLGAGGLIRAYTNAAATAIKQASLYTLIKRPLVKLTMPYALHDGFLYQNKDVITILNKTYGEHIEMELILNDIALEVFKSNYHQLKIIDLGLIDVKMPKID